MPRKNNRHMKSKINNSMETNHCVVAGYEFQSEAAAQEAQNELNAIKYMSSRTNKDDPAQIYLLYNKILEKKLLKTAVGVDFLKQLQSYLNSCELIPKDKIKPIPVESQIQEKEKKEKKGSNSKEQKDVGPLKRKADKYKKRSVILATVTTALLLVIAILTYVLMSGSGTTVLNYEVNIQNKYASWAEDLKAKEEALKVREKDIKAKEELQNKSVQQPSTQLSN